VIQDSEVHGPSYIAMASSSKQNTNRLAVKKFRASGLSAKTEALYAFRTITTMLSLIQSTKGTAGNRPKFGANEKQLLQLLDALAAVLVRNNGVIAVTARPYDGSGKVEVLTSHLGNGESLTISQPFQFLRNVFISQNPRDPTVKQQEVVDPETSVPSNFKKISEPSKLLTTFLTDVW
jgi:hypothetical protein